LDNILKAGAQVATHNAASGGNANNPIVDLITELGGLDAIEQLQDHDNHNIYQKAVRIIEMYFGGEEEEEDTTIMPDVDAGAQQYSFGAPPGGGGGYDGAAGGQPNVFNFAGPS
jgi:importin subunit alpha-1